MLFLAIDTLPLSSSILASGVCSSKFCEISSRGHIKMNKEVEGMNQCCRVASFHLLITNCAVYCDDFCFEKSVPCWPCIYCVTWHVCFDISVINGTKINTVFLHFSHFHIYFLFMNHYHLLSIYNSKLLH